MELFGNPISGYTTQYYSELIEKMAKANNESLSEEVFYLTTRNIYEESIPRDNFNMNYEGNRGNRNASSQIFQEGLKKRTNIRSKNNLNQRTQNK